MTPSHLLTLPLLLAPGVSICARQAESWAGTRWGGSPPLLAAFPRTGKGRQVADALALLGEAPRAAAYVKVKANPRGARRHLALVLCTSVLPPSVSPAVAGAGALPWPRSPGARRCCRRDVAHTPKAIN